MCKFFRKGREKKSPKIFEKKKRFFKKRCTSLRCARCARAAYKRNNETLKGAGCEMASRKWRRGNGVEENYYSQVALGEAPRGLLNLRGFLNLKPVGLKENTVPWSLSSPYSWFQGWEVVPMNLAAAIGHLAVLVAMIAIKVINPEVKSMLPVYIGVAGTTRFLYDVDFMRVKPPNT